MDTNDDTISLYEKVAELTAQMLAAARLQDWKKLAELEGACAYYAQKITQQTPREALTGSALERKIATIKQILADDRQIRDLTQPWMARLSAIMEGRASELPTFYKSPPL